MKLSYLNNICEGDQKDCALGQHNSCRSINFEIFAVSINTHKFNKYFRYRRDKTLYRNKINMTFDKIKRIAARQLLFDFNNVKNIS